MFCYYDFRHNLINLSNNKPVRAQKEDALSKILVKQINRIITNNLADKVPHILSAQVSRYFHIKIFIL